MPPRVRNLSKDTIEELLINTENNFDKFQTSISSEKILKLNKEFKKHEKKGFINYITFIHSMKAVFDNINNNGNNNGNNSIYTNYINSTKNFDTINDLSINSDAYDDIYNLFFKRFREIKCIIKNDKEVLYLTEFKNENYISTYKVIYALIIFLFAKFEDKLELLFKVSDLDEDGLINATEIRRMIIIVNHLFVEETNTIKMSSSILSQSLTNIKVENILKELFEGQGDLNNKLAKNGFCIDYKTFYQSVISIKNYKYKLIPCFISFKDCLFSKKNEQVIKVKQKIKNDFINISSSFIADQCQTINKSFNSITRYSKDKLNDIIQPIQFKGKNKKIVIKSNNNTFLKSLMKNCSTILDNNISSLNANDSLTEKISNSHHNLDKSKNSNLAFQAHYSDIKNIEVEPGVVQILSNEDNKEKSSIEIHKSNKNMNNKINNKNKFIRKNMFKYDTHINLKKNPDNIRLKLLKHNNISNEKSFSSKMAYPYLPFNPKNQKLNIKGINKGNKEAKKSYFNIYNNNYKTIEDILKEIKLQEKIFNYESIRAINKEMVNESNNSDAFMRKMKNAFIVRSEKPRRSSSFLGILYHKKSNLPLIFTKRLKKGKV